MTSDNPSLLQLILLSWKVSLLNLLEYLKVICKFYTNTHFAKTDLTLLKHYLFRSPFRISRQFLAEKQASDLYTYGETPLTTMALIANRIGITASDKVIELGAGRGRGCFWLNAFKKCETIGVEWVPHFVEVGNQVKSERKLTHLEFLCADFFSPDFWNSMTDATVIYLYGSCLSDEEITRLIELMKSLKPHCKVVTISFSLTDYQVGNDLFELIDQFEARFTWGIASVFICQKRK